MLTAESDGVRVEAETANRANKFVCPECKRVVILHRGKKYVAHFKHKAHGSCQNSGESKEHLSAKKLLLDEYRRRGFISEAEWSTTDEYTRLCTIWQPLSTPIQPSDRRRTDVMVRRSKDNCEATYVIEIQDSNLERSDFLCRIATWESMQARILWVALPKKEYRQKYAEMSGAKECWKIRRYAPRPFERWIEKRFGEIWYLETTSRKFFRAVFEAHLLQIDSKEYWDANAMDMAYSDAYETSSVRYVDVKLEAPVEITNVKIGGQSKGKANFTA